MDVKVGLKIGALELEFEGSDKMFESKIEPILKDLVEFGKDKFSPSVFEVQPVRQASKPSGALPAMTIKSVAVKFGSNSGSELLYAAVASLAIFKKKETFTRHELNDEMKLATGYYKTSYTSNLSNYIDTLCTQGTLIEAAKDTYAVQSSELTIMEQKLAQ